MDTRENYHALAKQNSNYVFTSPDLISTASAGVGVVIEHARRHNNAILDSDVGFKAATF